MTEVTAISAQAAALLVHYSFDLDCDNAEQLVGFWLTHYPSHWVRLAVVEALYQGRYKAVSVEHILAIWQRRGQPLYHFNHEFERLVCSHFFQELIDEPEALLPQEQVALPALEVAASEPTLAPPTLEQTGEEENDTDTQTVAELPTPNQESENLSSATPLASQVVKHTDFHTKLSSVAHQGKKNQDRDTKQPGDRRRRTRNKDNKS